MCSESNKTKTERYEGETFSEGTELISSQDPSPLTSASIHTSREILGRNRQMRVAKTMSDVPVCIKFI